MFKAFPLLLLVVFVYNPVALGGPVIVGGEDVPVAQDVAPAEAATPDEPEAEAAEPDALPTESDAVPTDTTAAEGAGEGSVAEAAEAASADGGPFSTYAFMEAEVLSVPMPSGSIWTLNYGDVFLIAGLLLLFVELVRSTSSEGNVITNHALSLGVLVLCLIEFIIVPGFATSTFFFLMLMAAIDVVAGFIISIRGARRDLSMS